MSEWRWVALGEISTIARGTSYTAFDLSEPGSGQPFITLKCFDKGGGFRLAGLKGYRSKNPPWTVSPGDLLIANTDLTREADIIGAPAIVPPTLSGTPAIISMDVSLVRVDDTRADKRFLGNVLRMPRSRRFMKDISAGSTVLHLNIAKVPELRIPLPPLCEQQKIAAIIDEIDDLIQATARLVVKLEQAKQGLLHDLLSQGTGDPCWLVGHRPEITPPASSDVPFAHWRWCRVGDILLTRPKNGYSPKAVDNWTGVLMLGLGCLTPNGFKPLQLKNAPPNDIILKSALLQDGDLLMSRSNTKELVGLVGRFRDVGVPCTYPDLMMKLVPNLQLVSPEFLQLVLLSPLSRRRIQAAASGTSGSMVKINSQVISDLTVPIPSVGEQNRIVRVHDNASSILERETTRLAKLRLLKQGLMDDLLTGRVRVKDVEDRVSV